MPMQILKEQNAIRVAILAVSIILSIQTNAQKKLKGNFSKLAVFQEGYDYYSFNETGSFEYHKGASLGDNYYGSGEYELNDNLLILNYRRTKNRPNSYYKSSFWVNSDKTILVNFNIKDESDIPILGVHIEIKELGISVTTDANGEASVIIDKSKKLFVGKVSYLGYDTCNFVFNSNRNYLFTVFLNNKPSGLPIKNQIDTLEVQNKGTCLVSKDKEISKWKKIQD